MIYEAEKVRLDVTADDGRQVVEVALVQALTAGPGVVVFKKSYIETTVGDATTAVFEEIIALERAAGGMGRGRFVKAGANDRVNDALDASATRHRTDGV